MTKAKKAMKAPPKAGTNFIKLDNVNIDTTTKESIDTTTKENEVPELVEKRKNIISGSKEAAKTRGIVYVSHLPHGFYEKQLRRYLEQFGSVTNLKVGRSEKTGASRGYAFVEFRYQEVAKTVAETMNNYLFFDKLLKCELVPQDKLRPSMFRNKINAKKPPLKKARSIAKRQVNKERDERQEQKRRRKQLQGLRKTAAKLKSLGVECSVDFPSIEKEILERKTRLKDTGGKTPTMAVDDSDLDITLKTPPNVRKIKSRSNSTATPRQASSKITEDSISKNLMKKRKLAMKADVIKDSVLDQESVEIDAAKQNVSAKANLKEKKKNLISSLKSKQKLLTPVVKSRAEKVDNTPKTAQKGSNAKSRRRSEPVKRMSE